MGNEAAVSAPFSPEYPKIWTKEAIELKKKQIGYKRATGREATRENILNSLTNGPVRGRFDEVSSAIDVLVAELDLDPSITHHILICYSNTPNSNLGYLRVQCVKALIKHNREKGDDLAKVFLSDPNGA